MNPSTVLLAFTSRKAVVSRFMKPSTGTGMAPLLPPRPPDAVLRRPSAPSTFPNFAKAPPVLIPPSPRTTSTVAMVVFATPLFMRST